VTGHNRPCAVFNCSLDFAFQMRKTTNTAVPVADYSQTPSAMTTWPPSYGRQTCRVLKLIPWLTSDSPLSEQILYKLEFTSSANVEGKYRSALLCDGWKRNQIACESVCYMSTKFVIRCADKMSCSIGRFFT